MCKDRKDEMMRENGRRRGAVRRGVASCRARGRQAAHSIFFSVSLVAENWTTYLSVQVPGMAQGHT